MRAAWLLECCGINSSWEVDKSTWRRKQQVNESRGFRQAGREAGAVEKRSFLRPLQSSQTSIGDQRVAVGGRAWEH